MLGPTLALLLMPVLLTSAASPIGSLSPATTPSHPHYRRQGSSLITFNSQTIPPACNSTCASTAPILDECEANTVGPVCLEPCDQLEPYAICINCILLNEKEDTAKNISMQVYANTNQTMQATYELCRRKGSQLPTTRLLPFDQIGTNTTSQASTGGAELRTSLGAMGAMVVAGGAGAAWSL